MFSRRERLSRADFPTALKHGRRFSSPHFVVVAPEGARGYAVVIPKKIARLSVTRHRLKRQIMEILHTLKLPPALIIFPRAAVSSVSYKDIETELSDIISKIH